MTPQQIAQGFGSLLRVRREQVKMDQAALAGRLGVSPEVIESWEEGAGSSLTLDQLGQVAEVLGTSIGALTPPAVNDLDDGVALQMPEDREILTGVRGGVDYYIYRCLVRTRTKPSLVPLVVDVLTDNPERARFNGGHAGSEFLFVLEGTIHMKWGDEDKPREAVLPTGTSMFIEEDVPHSFTAAAGTGSAKLLAVNF